MWRRLSVRTAILTLVLGLGMSAVALGASASGPLNRYFATLALQPASSSSARSPVPLGLTEHLDVRPHAGVNADPITSLRLSLSQVRAEPGIFPTCTASQVNAVHSDAGCPSGALVGTARLATALWSPSQPAIAGQPCLADLDIWNAGAGRLTAFLSFSTSYGCDDLQTGAVSAWTGTLSESGQTLRIDLPFVPGISTDTGGTGLFTAMGSLSLSFPGLSRSVGESTVGFLESTGCHAHRRRAELEVDAVNGASAQNSSLAQISRC